MLQFDIYKNLTLSQKKVLVCLIFSLKQDNICIKTTDCVENKNGQYDTSVKSILNNYILYVRKDLKEFKDIFTQIVSCICVCKKLNLTKDQIKILCDIFYNFLFTNTIQDYKHQCEFAGIYLTNQFDFFNEIKRAIEGE